MPAVWHDFVVEEERADVARDWCLSFTANSFKEGISVSQCFSGRLTYIRRRHNCAYMDEKRTLTAITFSAHMIRGQKRAYSRSCLPVALPEVVGEVEVDEAGDAAGMAEEREALMEAGAAEAGAYDLIAMATMVRKGWTISYRKHCPEKKAFKLWRQRWSKARARFQAHEIPLQAGQTRPSVERNLARQKQWSENRKRRKVA